MIEYTDEDLGEGIVLRIYANGTKFWYKNGEIHREEGPAVEYANGDKYWYKNGKLHREDGPAVDCADGGKQYWLFDKFYNSLPPPEKIKIIRKEQEIKGLIL